MPRSQVAPAYCLIQPPRQVCVGLGNDGYEVALRYGSLEEAEDAHSAIAAAFWNPKAVAAQESAAC